MDSLLPSPGAADRVVVEEVGKEVMAVEDITAMVSAVVSIAESARKSVRGDGSTMSSVTVRLPRFTKSCHGATRPIKPRRSCVLMRSQRPLCLKSPRWTGTRSLPVRTTQDALWLCTISTRSTSMTRTSGFSEDRCAH